ncbi:DUF4391 domain-containing protein [Atopobiaceae bacterium 24-176]
MSAFDWNDALRLPDGALAGDRRVPKSVLAKQALLTKTERKVLDKVRRIGHFATVQKSTTRVPPHADDERDIQSVVVLHCEMADSAAYAEVARLLHKCFPNPTVILFDGPDEACVSVASTRKSLAEQGAIVVDVVESTGGFSVADEAYRPFLDSLAFDRLSQEDLLAFLDDLQWNVRLSCGIGAVGFFPQCPTSGRERLAELVARYGSLAGELDEIVKRRRSDKDLTLNEGAHLRMRMRQLQNELDDVSDKIKEVCRG